MNFSEPLTTSKFVWWIFILFVPLLALALLSWGAPALPVALVVTAIPIYLTHRLLRSEWKTRQIVMLLFAASTVAAVIVAFTDPAQETAMHIPGWVSSIFGFYFMAAPLFMAACVLVELHRVKLQG